LIQREELEKEELEVWMLKNRQSTEKQEVEKLREFDK
jgi:hypothetical protein